MAFFNEKCRLKGYEDTADWYLAWKAYGYLLGRKELLEQDKYKKLYDIFEEMVQWHKMWIDPVPTEEMERRKSVYRIMAKADNDMDKGSFVLTDEIADYLCEIYYNEECRKGQKIIDWVFDLKHSKPTR